MSGLQRLLAPRLVDGTGRWLHAGLDLRAGMPSARSTVWWRTGIGGRMATPAPPDGPWDGIVVRLPKAKDDATMVLELCAARLAPDGVLWAAGPQDEGAKGIARRLGQWFEDVDDEIYGGHARAARARRPRADLRGALEDWREEVTVSLPSGEVTLSSWPGLFAHGRLDAGTALLLSVLPSAAGLRVLDLGCGNGVVSRALLPSGPASLDLVDVDALAVHAARLNVEGAHVEVGDGIPAKGGPWDLVVSNPPLHTGAAVDLDLVRSMPDRLRGRLGRDGVVLLVTHATVPVQKLFADITPRAERLAAKSPYVVWRLSR